MKIKNIITSCLIFASGVLLAQDAQDAMRYSQEQLNGTARYKAMGGAFGALGGDLSAIAQNPAGSSVFNVGQVGVSIGNADFNDKTNFFGNTEKQGVSNFNMNQLGSVFVFRNYNPNSNWSKFAIGFNYQKTNLFEGNHLNYSGMNKEQSVIDFFGNHSQGFSPSDLELKGQSVDAAYRDIGINGGYAMQQAFLGFQGYLLNADNDKGTYSSRGRIPATGVRQTYNFQQYGDSRKFSFNLSAEYGKLVYLGFNLNSHIINYRNYRKVVEDKYELDSDVQYIDFANDLYTYGGGFSLQLGAIVKATKDLRLGLTYQSPTWYSLQDETQQSLDVDVFKESNTTTDRVVIRPNVTNIYEKYNLQTPSQWTASIAYIFGKKAILSLDYIYKGYSKAQFKNEKSSDEFIQVNREIKDLFADTNSIRFGGELRVTPRFSVRGGYRFEQSPYKDTKTIGNLMSYSAGLGYDFGSISLDASFNIAKQNSQYQMFASGLTSVVDVSTIYSDLVLTLAIKL